MSSRNELIGSPYNTNKPSIKITFEKIPSSWSTCTLYLIWIEHFSDPSFLQWSVSFHATLCNRHQISFVAHFFTNFFHFFPDGDDPPGALLENTSGVSTTNAKSISAPVLNSVSEVRAPNPETAGFFLDSALDAMNSKDEPVGHFVFTLHVYQYSVDKNGKGGKLYIWSEVIRGCRLMTTEIDGMTRERERKYKKFAWKFDWDFPKFFKYFIYPHRHYRNSKMCSSLWHQRSQFQVEKAKKTFPRFHLCS